MGLNSWLANREKSFKLKIDRKYKAKIRPDSVDKYETICYREKLEGDHFKLSRHPFTYKLYEPSEKEEKTKLTSGKGRGLEVSLATLAKLDTLAEGGDRFPITVQTSKGAVTVKEEERKLGKGLPFYVMEVELEGSHNPASQDKLTAVAHRLVYKKWDADGAAPTAIVVKGGSREDREYTAATGNTVWGLRERAIGSTLELKADAGRKSADIVAKNFKKIISHKKKKGLGQKIVEGVAYAMTWGMYQGGENMRAENEGCIQYVEDAENTDWGVPEDVATGAQWERVGILMRDFGIGLAIGIPVAAGLYIGVKKAVKKKRHGHWGGTLREKEIWGSFSKNGLAEYVAAMGLVPSRENPSASAMINWMPEDEVKSNYAKA